MTPSDLEQGLELTDSSERHQFLSAGETSFQNENTKNWTSSGSDPRLPTYRPRMTKAIHRDAFARHIEETDPDVQELLQARNSLEACIDPLDGRLRKLQVQCAGSLQHDCSWSVSKITSTRRAILLTIVDWFYDSYASENAEGKALNMAKIVPLYVPLGLAIGICIMFQAKVDIENDSFPNYEPILYRNWTFPGMTRSSETSVAGSHSSRQSPVTRSDKAHKPSVQGLIARHPMPRYLCYVDGLDPPSVGPDDAVAKAVPEDTFVDYVFVSYTRSQYHTGASSSADLEERLEAHQNRLALLDIGIRAAKAARVPAFWLDCYPLVDVNEDKEDVYRICDIVRTAHSVVIAINPASLLDVGIDKTGRQALLDWGNRLWTLPELLLSSSQHKIAIYDCNHEKVDTYHKRNLGYLTWDDWQDTSQLVDHYTGTVHLTQLELISIANRCLRRRKTNLRKPGDYAYALMGLLRRRPQTVETDSDFMAFARLSLENSNDSIIERLLCMQPLHRDTPWHSMVDAYGAQLSDIEITCQIADIGTHASDTETVVLDGAFGASICWSKLETVTFFKRATMIRTLTKTILPKAPWIATIALFYLIVLAATSSPFHVTTWHFWILSVVGTAISMSSILTSPSQLHNLYYGKFWSTQARLYGIQGLADLIDVERRLFGLSDGRLKWSTSGSLWSSPCSPEDGQYYEGKAPTHLQSRDDEGRYLFTIIDTYALEATAFYADRPPTVVLICGKEGGMQRAVLCSYDWVTQTFCREVVLKMKTIVLNRMTRVDQCRVSFRRFVTPVAAAGQPEVKGAAEQTVVEHPTPEETQLGAQQHSVRRKPVRTLL